MAHASNNYILFVDESGKSKISDEGDHFLLCGLIINKDLHAALSSYMVSLKDKSLIPPNENIHAFDLLEKEQVNGCRHTLSHINTFFDRLCTLVQGADIKCIIARVDKREYKQMVTRHATRIGSTDRAIMNILKRNDLHDILYEALARKLFLEFGHFLEQEDAHGEVVAESRRWDDDAVLRAFIDSTQTSRFEDGSTYHLWASQAFKRIYSLTFQNKKGLSFGLEAADLFAWAHFNKHYGKARTFPSVAKNTRIDTRIDKVNKITKETLIKGKVEDITKTKLTRVAKDRVSKFTETLRNLKKSQ